MGLETWGGEEAGKVVGREERKRRAWPAGVCVLGCPRHTQIWDQGMVTTTGIGLVVGTRCCLW